MIVDLHTHSIFSDGVLVPAESVRRACAAGYSGIAVTDHADASNYIHILECLKRFKDNNNNTTGGIKVLAGVEFTHVRPQALDSLVQEARVQGADIVIVHGESIVEPVESGTNRAAIMAGVDILAHPGLITEEDAHLAAEKGVCLEISTRRGHSLTNGHVARMATLMGATLIINNDFHTPGDYVGEAQALRILEGAGLSVSQAELVVQNTVDLFNLKLNG